MDKNSIITMITDFGTRSHYVASMKAIMYRINPNLSIVDITHSITPFNIFEAAFILKSAYAFFPQETIHLVVIDPEVGGERKPVLVATLNHYFVGPDNGVFSYIYEDLANEGFSVYHLTESHYFRSTISPTFHGRDIFAPAAAWLSRGVDPADMGPKLEDYTKVNLPKPSIQENVLTCTVMHIDSFGNIITNLHKNTFRSVEEKLQTNKFAIQLPNTVIDEIHPSYFSLEKKGIGAVFGSTDHLEIAAYKKPAYKVLNLNLFSQIKIVFNP
jgi:S-adenosylmethionine hydrolase